MASSSTEKLLPLLDPIDPPLGLNAAFCNSTTTQTVVVEKNLRSWSGQDFGIKDVQSGEVVVSCEGKVGSWREKKVFKDAEGRELFRVRWKPWPIRTQVIESLDGKDELCTINAQFSLRHCLQTVHFVNTASGSAQPEPLELDVTGSWTTMEATIKIKDTDSVVATMTRDSIWSKTGTSYAVSVAPGVDVAFVAALAICFEDAFALQ